MIKMILLITLLILAVISDLQTYKVKNEITFTYAILGTIYNILIGNSHSVMFGLLGLVIPFIVLIPLYALHMLGAGDIKLFCSIGALVGIGDVMFSIAYSFIFGLIIAIIIMIIQRNFAARMKKLFNYFKSCFLCMKIMPYDEFNSEGQGNMHFSIPIAIGTIVASMI